MKHFGIEFDIVTHPYYDEEFLPIGAFNRAFEKTAKQPFGIALIRPDGQTAVSNAFVHGSAEMFEADYVYLERLVKTLLWMKGGSKIILCGDSRLSLALKAAYAPSGFRAFDVGFMSRVFETPLTVEISDCLPEEKSVAAPIGRHLEGCRIGFDAGGSDRKVSAVIDGQPVYSEEVVWFPKTNADPQYHYDGIVAAFKEAAAHMPRVDAIGVSSAGVYINNRAMIASLFLKVPDQQYERHVKDIYLRAAREIGDIPVSVCNDGDVTALAGAMSLNQNNILGIAMGTSEAAGFVDRDGNITGWLNELAFAPVDLNPAAMADEWSGDVGCGVKYFSQDGVIKLAQRAGVNLGEAGSPAEKLKLVQELAMRGDPKAITVFSDVGVYLGHTLPHYYHMYGCANVLLLGRVLSGKGGEQLVRTAEQVLRQEYPEVSAALTLRLPDEKSRRVGQSVAAASLPAIG